MSVLGSVSVLSNLWYSVPWKSRQDGVTNHSQQIPVHLWHLWSLVCFFFSFAFTVGKAIEKVRDGMCFRLLKRNKQTCAQLFETNSVLNRAALTSRDSEAVSESCSWSQKCECFYPFPDPLSTHRFVGELLHSTQLSLCLTQFTPWPILGPRFPESDT